MMWLQHTMLLLYITELFFMEHLKSKDYIQGPNTIYELKERKIDEIRRSNDDVSQELLENIFRTSVVNLFHLKCPHDYYLFILLIRYFFR